MGAFRIFSKFAELLDVKVTRAANAWLRLNTDGSVSQRTAAQTLTDIGAMPENTAVILNDNDYATTRSILLLGL